VDAGADADASRPDARDATTDEGGPPTTVPLNGLVLWLRADRGVNTQSGQVAEWQDQSGNNLHATQTTPSARPALMNAGIGNRPSVAFDGADDFMRLPSGFSNFSNGVSIFAVVQHATRNNCTPAVELSNGSEADDIHLGQDQSQLIYEVFNDWHHAGTFTFNTPQLIAAVHQTNQDFEMRRNGSVIGGNSMPLPLTILRQQNYVGRSLYGGCTLFPGLMAELMIYNRAVSDAEINEIETYLRDRVNCCRQ
jgi:hypothetical protein